MINHKRTSAALLAPAILLAAANAGAEIAGNGVYAPVTDCTTGATTRTFNLTATSGHIALGDGNSLLAWGYGKTGSGIMQYPGSVLMACEGDTISVTLDNALPVPVSIVFPGQGGVAVTGGDADGVLTREVGAGVTAKGATTTHTPVTYTFTASRAGTFMYESGTSPELEIEMGLVGALIVRPAGFLQNAGTTDWTTFAAADTTATPIKPQHLVMSGHPHRSAYSRAGGMETNPATNYDREYLFFLTDMDRRLHEERVEPELTAQAALTTPLSGDALLADLVAVADPASAARTLWFINGRNGPDTMHPDNIGWLPLQPLGGLARMHPGERVLMRVIGAGSDSHPFHHHGNNAWQIAHDAVVLESADGAAAVYPDYVPPDTNGDNLPDLAVIPEVAGGAELPDESMSNYTIQSVPGSTNDAIWTWTGIGLNWDIYGNRPGHDQRLGCDKSSEAARLATLEVNEDPNSHCNSLSGDLHVALPEQQALTFGGLWSGSPFLGQVDPLPPLQGGLNPGGGFSFMWHSHTERELTNDDIFPGGMMTMMIVEAIPRLGGPDACIEDDYDEDDTGTAICQ